MSDAVRIISKSGKPYLEKHVGKFVIPEQFKGQFLSLKMNGDIVYRILVKKTEAEKNHAKEEMNNKRKAKWSEVKTEQKFISSKIAETLKEISAVKREIISSAKKNLPITALQQKRNSLEDALVSLKSQRRNIPSQYKK